MDMVFDDLSPGEALEIARMLKRSSDGVRKAKINSGETVPSIDDKLYDVKIRDATNLAIERTYAEFPTITNDEGKFKGYELPKGTDAFLELGFAPMGEMDRPQYEKTAPSFGDGNLNIFMLQSFL